MNTSVPAINQSDSPCEVTQESSNYEDSISYTDEFSWKCDADYDDFCFQQWLETTR